MSVSSLRLTQLNNQPLNADGDFVLYWMIANRRLHYNFALQRAVDIALDLQKPVLILEALRADYQWSSNRLHRFILQGMADNTAAAARAGVSYVPYVEPHAHHGSGLLENLSDNACVVVTDDFPCFFLPRMVRTVARRLNVCCEMVDSNGLYPMRATDRVFTTAFSFRNHLQKTLEPFLNPTEFPSANPLENPELIKTDCVPSEIIRRWQPATPSMLEATPATLSQLPIDHSVGAAIVDGGESAARQRLQTFLNSGLHRYGQDRNQPDDDPSSGLSPYLHFGHVSAHEVFLAVAESEEWTSSNLGDVALVKGSREGWWGMSPSADAFLDELITWRELGYNACCHDPDYDKYTSLPDYARKTLHKHAIDQRPFLYSYEDFSNAETHDEIWNAAQTQLVTEGRMHNYLRMLWGKKILEWTESPEQALEFMVALNNRFAVDGRNPNSYSGIFWVLGRYDRAWGPERPVFGKIRFMSSDSTRKKLKLAGYLKKYGSDRSGRLF